MKNVALVHAESPSQAVINEVAAREGVDPTDLKRPLFEAIDPDALDALAGTTAGPENQTPVHVEFTYCGYDVCVSADGAVSVSQTE